MFFVGGGEIQMKKKRGTEDRPENALPKTRQTTHPTGTNLGGA